MLPAAPTVSTCSGVTRAHRLDLARIRAVVRFNLARDRPELRLRLLERCPWPQPTDNAQKVIEPLRAASWALNIDRHPQLDARHERIVEGIGEHGDDLLSYAVDRQHLADRIGPGAEILAPYPFADDDEVGAGPLVRASERLSREWPHAEHAKVVGPDQHHRDAFGLGPVGQVRAFAVVGVDRCQIERRALVPEGAERWRGHVAVGIAVDVIHADEPIRLVIRQRGEHDRIEHAEDGRVRAQSEGERHDHDRGELLRGP